MLIWVLFADLVSVFSVKLFTDQLVPSSLWTKKPRIVVVWPRTSSGWSEKFSYVSHVLLVARCISWHGGLTNHGRALVIMT